MLSRFSASTHGTPILRFQNPKVGGGTVLVENLLRVNELGEELAVMITSFISDRGFFSLPFPKAGLSSALHLEQRPDYPAVDFYQRIREMPMRWVYSPHFSHRKTNDAGQSPEGLVNS